MKQSKTVLISIAIGLAIGFGLGFNYGRDKPLLSNPFEIESIGDRAKRLSVEALKESGKALEKSGQELQDKLKKQ